jgi:hypothetical protein
MADNPLIHPPVQPLDKKWLYLGAGVAILLIIIGLIIFFVKRKGDTVIFPTPKAEKTENPQKVDYATRLLRAINPVKENYEAVPTYPVNLILNGMNTYNTFYYDITGKKFIVPSAPTDSSNKDAFDTFSQNCMSTAVSSFADISKEVITNKSYNLEDKYRHLGTIFLLAIGLFKIPMGFYSLQEKTEGDKITSVYIKNNDKSSPENLIAQIIARIQQGISQDNPRISDDTYKNYLTDLESAYPPHSSCLKSTDLCVAGQMINQLANLTDNFYLITDLGKLALLMFYTGQFK